MLMDNGSPWGDTAEDRWTPLTGVAPMGAPSVGPSRASYVASTLSASLELVKEGALEARQLEAFADIYLRARREEKSSPAGGGGPRSGGGGFSPDEQRMKRPQSASLTAPSEGEHL